MPKVNEDVSFENWISCHSEAENCFFLIIDHYDFSAFWIAWYIRSGVAGNLVILAPVAL